jgi:hypothetical protein
MKSKDLAHDQWMALSDIYGEMQGKCVRIDKRLQARTPPGTGDLCLLNRRAMDLMQELRMHCLYAGIEARRAAEGWVRPENPTAAPSEGDGKV